MNTPAHTIEITITPEGEVKSTVKGVKGVACHEISKWLDDLGKVTHDSKTPDFFQGVQQVGTIKR
jgi:hypothetical protein